MTSSISTLARITPSMLGGFEFKPIDADNWANVRYAFAEQNAGKMVCIAVSVIELPERKAPAQTSTNI